MVFSSPIFLFLFLPILLAVFGFTLLCSRKHSLQLQNRLLLLASLLFYAWGEGIYLLLMIGSIVFNHYLALVIQKNLDTKKAQQILTFGVLANLCTIALYKYGSFIVENVNLLLTSLQLDQLPIPAFHLPLGISFFTFQAISYLVDVYRRDAKAQTKLSETALYISLFPQLIAGPIVRFKEIAPQFKNRVISVEQFALGAKRFIYGLAKKVLIANTLAVYVDYAFALQPEHLTSSIAWFTAISYSLQIYFDFSGYSDMAIGLGQMFGFRLPENFQYPYTARSVREFWQKWHISLSNWFRDYVYIPLGGNRKSPLRIYLNLCIVFFLCGLWHGAQWSFVAWGLLHGLFLVLERTKLGKRIQKCSPNILQHIYTILIVALAWVLFRAETFSAALLFYKRVFFFSHLFDQEAAPNAALVTVQTGMFYCAFITGIFLSMPLYQKITKNIKSNLLTNLVSLLFPFILFLLSACSLASNTYNPFIYFRF